jgi:uncharacterized protein
MSGPENEMPPLTVMFKTISTCNLDCDYCYYRGSAAGPGQGSPITSQTLETFMPGYMEYVADARQASLSWQGGEPTLAGLDFFRQVVSLEAKYAPRPMSISNSIQTNGLLIDDTWAEFFAEFNFLAGISLDDPQPLHDARRKDPGGRGSFRRVMNGLDALRRHGVDTNVLCVLTPDNVTQAGQLVDFFTGEGLGYLQFLPAMAFKASEPQSPASYLISPSEYGRFLTSLFDRWYLDGVPGFSVRTFNNVLQSLLGAENDLCLHAETCRAGLVIEANGDVFPCDFYIHPDWRLGNILTDPLSAMAGGSRAGQFSKRKRALSPACRACEFVSLCRGECPRNRLPTPGGAPGASFFCTSYKALFRHSLPRFRELAGRLQNYRRYLDWQRSQGSQHEAVVPGAHAPCPCGSGRVFSGCCGDTRLSRSYLFQPGS